MNIQILETLVLCACACSLLTPIVEISQGKLRGLRGLFGQNRYYNIPYAVADRFRRPSEPQKWKGVYEAIHRNPELRCPQWRRFLVFGREDCLLLDVFSPESVPPQSKVPVMVYFHGGAYYMGAKNLYDPQFLVLKNVVVVTVNYRLGVLGFLCLNEITNLGLRDQVAALKWIRNNIAAFNGDEENVTICGESAGASSAAFHLLSESSKGLFHRVILMSGTALSVWAFNQEPVEPAMQDARKLAIVTTQHDVIKTFNATPLDTLIEATKDTSVNPRHFKYSPCVDTFSTDPFFRGAPYDLIKSGNFNQVPVMMGYTECEGSYFYGLLDSGSVAYLNDNFEQTVPSLFSWCPSNRKKIGRLLRSHYFGNRDITMDSVRDLISFYSDWVAYAANVAFSKVLTKYSHEPVYNYLFAYEGGREFAKTFIPHLPGPVHAGELFYIFKPFGIPLWTSPRDKKFIEKLTTMITNFMRYGKPTIKKTKALPVEWARATRNSSNIMVLDSNLSVIRKAYKRHSGEFFLKLLCDYGQAGYVPCDSAQICLT
ncbi:unnamed protein product [Leptosia nina]|uniref:Carboxylesterase type B domain-containing protein n=1 Tax=Leptosia nina TaxID=320188 RepID=A0AAV1JWD2_9NEOP